MYLLKLYLVSLETFVVQRRRSSPPSISYTTLENTLKIRKGGHVHDVHVQRLQDFNERGNWRWCLNYTVQKDSRGVLGTSSRFGPTSEILENIQYGGSSVVKTDTLRSRFIAREARFTVLLTQFAFIVSFEVFLVLYSKQSFYKCLINLSCPAGRYYRKK